MKCQSIDCERPAIVKVREGTLFVHVCGIHMQGRIPYQEYKDYGKA